MNQEQITAMASIMVEARRAHEDVGEIIAVSLGAAAEKLGDVEDLVRGRPGSWEAEIVRRMAVAGKRIGGSLTRLYAPYVKRLVPLFVELGGPGVDGGDVLSAAMSEAVDALGGLDEFGGQSEWYDDLTNLGRQYSSHWND